MKHFVRNLQRLALLISAFQLFSISAFSADRITATLTITNAPTTNGQTFVVNGDTRTWTNSVFNAATQILTNNTIAGVTTNLYNHLLSTPPTAVTPYLTASNVIRLDARTGTALTVAGVTNYFTVSYSTQTVTTATDVIVPMTAVPSSLRPAIRAGLIEWLNTVLASGGTLLVAETNLSIGDNVYNDASDESHGFMPKRSLNPLTVFNAVYGWVTLHAMGAVTNNSTVPTTLHNGLTVSSNFNALSGAGGTVIINAASGLFNDSSGNQSIDAFSRTLKNSSGVTVLDYETGTYYGINSGFTANSTNTFPAGSDIAFGRYAVTSLANGVNAAVPVGTNVFVEVSGPSAAFSLDGINGSPNRDGKLVVVLNQTGFDMTIAHQSGSDATAANRIISLTGANRTTTGNGAATLIYSGAASRWILIAFDP